MRVGTETYHYHSLIKHHLFLPVCSQGQNPFESDDFTKNGSHLMDSFNFDSSPRHGECRGSITVTSHFFKFSSYFSPNLGHTRGMHDPSTLDLNKAFLSVQTCPQVSPSTSLMPRRETRRKSVAGQLTVSLDDLRV